MQKASTQPTNVLTPEERQEALLRLPDIDEKGELSSSKYKPNNVVFLIDISYSMKSPTKLPLLKQSMKELITVLRDVDKVTVITYASSTNVAVPTVIAGKNKAQLMQSIDNLQAGGITKGSDGLQRAYKIIEEEYLSDGNNQIFLATDGQFTDLAASEKELYQLVKDENEAKDVKISVIGFGAQEKSAKFMKKLAESGNGHFLEINTSAQVDELLINEIKSLSIKL